jgi:hypothetical protein
MKITLNKADAVLGVIKVKPTLRDSEDPFWVVEAALEVELVPNAAGEVLDLADGALSQMAKEARRIQDDQAVAVAVKFGALEWMWRLERVDGRGDPLEIQGSAGGRTQLVLKAGESPVLKLALKAHMQLPELATLMALSVASAVRVTTSALQTDIEEFIDPHEHANVEGPRLLEAEIVEAPLLLEAEPPQDVA